MVYVSCLIPREIFHSGLPFKHIIFPMPIFYCGDARIWIDPHISFICGDNRADAEQEKFDCFFKITDLKLSIDEHPIPWVNSRINEWDGILCNLELFPAQPMLMVISTCLIIYRKSNYSSSGLKGWSRESREMLV